VALTFDCGPHGQVISETSLCLRVKDKGLVLVSGCCHQGMSKFAGFAKEGIDGGQKLYGFYGGLHIAPYERLSSKGQFAIDGLAECEFERIGCNHCTGLIAIEKMLDMGYPIVKGSGRFGSNSDFYLGNGDEVCFG
jgi:7,8-dihydropterin-6-yl-methyl-4-(beta-D-ribofuranosyl)aminobenzene 5'-phosphate synthase